MKAGKELLKPALILCFICLFASALLAGIHHLTEPAIASRAEQEQQAARTLVLPQAIRFAEEKQHTREGTAYSYYTGFDRNDRFAGLVILTAVRGYGGEIRVITGVDARGAVAGVTFLELNETPGLGMKAAEPGFLSQFLHKQRGISLVKSDAGANEIMAITGATVTSDAVTQAVNLALAIYEEVMQ